MAEESFQAGVRPQRIQWVREINKGEVPNNPEWFELSDAVQNWPNWEPDANTQRQDKQGSLKPGGFFNGSETHDASFEYHLKRWFVKEYFTDPSSSTTLGVKSTDSSDTNIDVTIFNDNETTSETITTNGTDGTTFVTGSTSFSTIGRVKIGQAAKGDIEVYENSSGSPGTKFGDVPKGQGRLNVEDVDAYDAAGDFLLVDRDNTVNDTHTYVIREEHNTGGVGGEGRRIYTVMKGGWPSSDAIPFETEDGSPINVQLDYQFEKVRQYSLDQPQSNGKIDVVSSDGGDTTQTVTLESEDASTSEDVTLNGTTTVTTSSKFSDLDAVEIDAETVGDVTVTDSDGNDLLVIKGQDSYPAGEGDLGIPALGTGTNQSVGLASSYVRFLDDTISLPSLGNTYDFISGELSTDLNLADNSREATSKRRIYSEAVDYTVTASVAGVSATVENVVDYLTESTGDIKWTADEGTLTVKNAFIQSPGETAEEAGQGQLETDIEFSGDDITITT